MRNLNRPDPPERWWETLLALVGVVFFIGGVALLVVFLEALWM